MAGLREQTERIITEALEERARHLNSSDWRDIGESDQVQGYQKEVGDIVFVKGVATINFPPNVVADFIWNNDNRTKFEEDVGFSNILHDFGNTRIEHILKKLPWPVDDRDMVHVTKRENVGEDVHIISRSIELDVPVEEGRVRSFTHVLSYYLLNIEDIATEVTLLVAANPKGSIPQLIINQVAGSQAFCLGKIRSALNA